MTRLKWLAIGMAIAGAAYAGMLACAWFGARYGLGAAVLLWGVMWVSVVRLVMGVRK